MPMFMSMLSVILRFRYLQKRKLSTKIGGANKTISFKDDSLVDFIQSVIKLFKFYGPLDIDLWEKEW